MKTYKAKSGQIMAAITVPHYISKYEIEATIGNLLHRGEAIKSAAQVTKELKDLLCWIGPDYLSYYWENNDKNILPACELIAKKYFPEFYDIDIQRPTGPKLFIQK